MSYCHLRLMEYVKPVSSLDTTPSTVDRDWQCQMKAHTVIVSACILERYQIHEHDCIFRINSYFAMFSVLHQTVFPASNLIAISSRSFSPAIMYSYANKIASKLREDRQNVFRTVFYFDNRFKSYETSKIKVHCSSLLESLSPSTDGSNVFPTYLNHVILFMAAKTLSSFSSNLFVFLLYTVTYPSQKCRSYFSMSDFLCSARLFYRPISQRL